MSGLRSGPEGREDRQKRVFFRLSFLIAGSFTTFDKYKYNPTAKPDQKHLDWDYLGFPEFKRRAAILKDDTETSRQPSWYEEHRARRIRENEAMMKSLGLT